MRCASMAAAIHEVNLYVTMAAAIRQVNLYVTCPRTHGYTPRASITSAKARRAHSIWSSSKITLEACTRHALDR